MVDTLEKRVADRDYLAEHVETLFAGADVKLAGLCELMLLQSSRIAKLDSRLMELSRKVDAQGSKLDEILARLPKS